MHLTTFEVEVRRYHEGAAHKSLTAEIDVHEDGSFSAEFLGEHFSSPQLSTLKGQLRDALIGSRAEVPFVTMEGRRGVMRGWHAGNYDILVTWEDGSKGKLGTYADVYPSLDASELEELQTNLMAVKTLQDGMATFEADRKERIARASDLLAQAVGEDLSDYRRNQES